MISRIEALLAAALPPLLHLIQSIFKPLPFFDCFYCSELFYSVTDITNKVNSLLLTSSWSLSNLGWCPLELALQINPIATRLSVDHTATDGNKKKYLHSLFQFRIITWKKNVSTKSGNKQSGKAQTCSRRTCCISEKNLFVQPTYFSKKFLVLLAFILKKKFFRLKNNNLFSSWLPPDC